MTEQNGRKIMQFVIILNHVFHLDNSLRGFDHFGKVDLSALTFLHGLLLTFYVFTFYCFLR